MASCGIYANKFDEREKLGQNWQVGPNCSPCVDDNYRFFFKIYFIIIFEFKTSHVEKFNLIYQELSSAVMNRGDLSLSIRGLILQLRIRIMIKQTIRVSKCFVDIVSLVIL